MKKLYKNAGIRIRFLREERHYTREYLAEMADISPKFLIFLCTVVTKKTCSL